MKRVENKKGQITIFIIVAIIIVVIGILIYMFYPQIKTNLGIEDTNPQAYIQNCIEKEIEENVNELSLQGGSLNPSNTINYNNYAVEYLCYTNEYYKPCIIQQPLLKNHIEEEVEQSIEEEVEQCFDSMVESFQKRGYNVNLKKGAQSIELLPKRVVATFDYSLSLSKESSETYDSFTVILNNNLYELISIANSIIEWETNYGDAETTVYMNYYHDLNVEKKKQSDGSTIYIITDRNTENKFQFASRSIAWPPGYNV